MQLNEKLHNILPPHIFCAAAVVEVDLIRGQLAVWNGWSPEVLCVNKEGIIKQSFASTRMPLGSLKKDKFNSQLDFISLDKGDKVFIKKLTAAEKFTTLDKIERDLIEGDTIISDNEKTLVLGGIMGGLNSGVTEKTTKIFIEVANWKPAMVRKSSVRLGLRTDSSQRYEKSLDSKLCERIS